MKVCVEGKGGGDKHVKPYLCAPSKMPGLNASLSMKSLMSFFSSWVQFPG